MPGRRHERSDAYRPAGRHDGRMTHGHALNVRKHDCLNGSAAKTRFLKDQAADTARAWKRNRSARCADRWRSMRRTRLEPWMESPTEMFRNFACYPLCRPSDGVRVALVRQVSWLAGLRPSAPSRCRWLMQGARRVQLRGQLRMRDPDLGHPVAFPFDPQVLCTIREPEPFQRLNGIGRLSQARFRRSLRFAHACIAWRNERRLRIDFAGNGHLPIAISRGRGHVESPRHARITRVDPHGEPPPPAPHRGNIDRQHDQPERQHPQAEHRKEGEETAENQQNPDTNTQKRAVRQRHLPAKKMEARAPLPVVLYHFGFLPVLHASKMGCERMLAMPDEFGISRPNSPVAQLVEQAAVNRWVAGSSPARGATFLLFSSHDLVETVSSRWVPKRWVPKTVSTRTGLARATAPGHSHAAPASIDAKKIGNDRRSTSKAGFTRRFATRRALRRIRRLHAAADAQNAIERREIRDGRSRAIKVEAKAT